MRFPNSEKTLSNLSWILSTSELDFQTIIQPPAIESFLLYNLEEFFNVLKTKSNYHNKHTFISKTEYTNLHKRLLRFVIAACHLIGGTKNISSTIISKNLVTIWLNNNRLKRVYTHVNKNIN